MSKVLTFCFLYTISVIAIGQNVISINQPQYPESSYNPKKLIEDVFLFGECSTVKHFSSQVFGKTSYLKSKSYGYFKNENTNFPFKDGIIITNGNAYKGGNKYIANGTGDDDPNRASAINDLFGDKDLEQALDIQETFDASFFKFSFMPTKNTLSFRFILASEEYDGRKECLFGDSFAFLLRERGTKNYKNMAILPSGEPISVKTINNSEYCRANPQYFEGYHVQQTNYDGRTKVLTAKANVIPGKEYDIKIVIADQRDFKWDSAIFLEGNSFNFQADVNLGEDITIKKGNALCQGESIMLDTKLPSNLTYMWYKNRTLLVGETKPRLRVTESGEYTVNVAYGSYCQLSDTAKIEFIPKANTTVLDLFSCDDGTGLADFNLLDNTPIIFKDLDNTLFNLNFYNSLSDVKLGVNPITNPQNFKGKHNQKIYFKTEYTAAAKSCPSIGEFSLKVKDLIINPVDDIELCDDYSNDGFEYFNLHQQDSAILGDLAYSNIMVTYYTNVTDANANTNALQSPYKNTSNSQPIYVRLQSINDASCYAVSATPVFKLIVKKRDNPAFTITPNCLGAAITITGDKGGALIFNPKLNDNATLSKINNGNWIITNADPKQTYTIQYTTSGECEAVNTQSFTPYALPDFNLDDTYILCINTNGTEINTDGLILDTGLSTNNYDFEWTLSENGNVLSKNSFIEPTKIGTYTVRVTNKKTGCERIAKTSVNSSSPPKISFKITNLNFTSKHDVIINATSSGILSDFEFSIDNGPWLKNNFTPNSYTFKSVAPGAHTLTVRDRFGCGIASIPILVLGYPPFFTPNNDTHNDTWKIIGIENFPSAKIYIFNRYGKLLKHLSPLSNGWNGKYNGKLLPSADYWFKVEYLDEKTNTKIQFTDHFSLKY